MTLRDFFDLARLPGGAIVAVVTLLAAFGTALVLTLEALGS